VELNIQWTPDFRSTFGSTKAAEAVPAPLSKKGGHSPTKGSNKSNKKQRGTNNVKGVTGVDKAAAPAARSGNSVAVKGDSAGGTGGSAADAGGWPLGAEDLTARPSSSTGSDLRLVDVLQDAEFCTLRGLADAMEVPTVFVMSSTIENESVDDDDRVAASADSQNLSLLLSFETVVDCMKFYPKNNIDDESSISSDSVLKVKSVSISTTTLTRTTVTSMLPVHSYNKDVAM